MHLTLTIISLRNGLASMCMKKTSMYVDALPFTPSSVESFVGGYAKLSQPVLVVPLHLVNDLIEDTAQRIVYELKVPSRHKTIQMNVINEEGNHGDDYVTQNTSVSHFKLQTVADITEEEEEYNAAADHIIQYYQFVFLLLCIIYYYLALLLIFLFQGLKG